MAGFDVKLDAFEGPFELLFRLIEKNEMDIFDIPIAELTDQYMEHIDAFSQRDMDGMSEFLLMAATLLEIKSAILLPNPKQDAAEDEDPRARLVEMLIQYKKYKEIAEILKERGQSAAYFLYKPREESLFEILKPVYTAEVNDLLRGITINALNDIFRDCLKRRELSYDKIRIGFGTVNMDKFTVSGKIAEISALLNGKKRIYFLSLIGGASSREEAVVMFCAVLEMIKLKQIQVSQNRNFGDIIIENYVRGN